MAADINVNTYRETPSSQATAQAVSDQLADALTAHGIAKEAALEAINQRDSEALAEACELLGAASYALQEARR